MDTEIGIIEAQRPSLQRFLFQAFWGLTAAEGLGSFFWFMSLPLSEAERAVFMGYSFTRLVILFLFGLVVVFSCLIFTQSLMVPKKNLRLQNAIKAWLEKHDFLATGLLSCLAVWAISGILLEILLNPALFPRSILYQFLYVRIRPIFLWSAVVSLQAFIVILASGWYALRREQPDSRGDSRRRFSTAAIIILVAGNLGLWLARGLDPDLTLDQNGLALAALLFLILLTFALTAVLHRPGASAVAVGGLTVAGQFEAEDESRGGLKLTFLFGGVSLLMLVWYGVSTFLVTPLADPNNMDRVKLLPAIFGFGFNQLRWSPAWLVIVWLVLTAAVMWAVERFPGRIMSVVSAATEFLYSRKRYLVLVSLVFTGLFLSFRSHLINDDTLNFMNWMPHQAAHGITHVRFDEMLESNLHFETYKLTNFLWAWDVQFTYNVISCLAGGVFIFFLLLFCRRLAGSKALLLFAFLISGGFMQLFFGDKENYTLAMTLLLVYFYFSHKYLKGEVSLTTPAFFLALAMMFHLETAYLLPTLFYLTVVELNRREYFSAASAWLLVASIFSLTMVYFVFRGSSWEMLRDTSWGLGRGGNVLFNMVIPNGFMIYARLNMMALIFPMLAFLAPVILAGGIKWDHLTGFTLAAAAVGLPFSSVWISTIGYYSDWNLFSMPMFSVILLLGICLFRSRPFRFKNSIVVGMTMVSFLASYTWIIHNHFLTPK